MCIYRIPDSDVFIFFKKLESLLHYLTRKVKKNIILCGDWNIDILKENKYSKELISILNNFNISLHVIRPTRKNTSIDQIASNIRSLDIKCSIHNLALSDHDTGQSLTFYLQEVNNNKSETVQFWYDTKRDYDKSNIAKFLDCLAAFSFGEIYEETDCNRAFNIFYDIFTLFYKLCFPEILVKKTNKPIKNK